MRSVIPVRSARVLLRASGLLAGVAATSFVGVAAPALPVVAVFSKTEHGYHRTLLPNNTFKPETYAFADGGRLKGSYDDPSIDNLKFVQVAGVVASSLKRENYIATTDPKSADLLIFVSYGTTTGVDEQGYQNAMGSLGADFLTWSSTFTPSPGIGSQGSRNPYSPVGTLGPSDSGNAATLINSQAEADELTNFYGIDGSLDRIALANQDRDRTNEFNAGILGYDGAWHETNVMRPYLNTARDILKEIEESRYFVVLQAYDFQALRHHQGKKLLWETRYSIPRAGRFDEQLVDMTRYASQFCGQDLGRLVRRHLREGRVEVGTPVEVPSSAK